MKKTNLYILCIIAIIAILFASVSAALFNQAQNNGLTPSPSSSAAPTSTSSPAQSSSSPLVSTSPNSSPAASPTSSSPVASPSSSTTNIPTVSPSSSPSQSPNPSTSPSPSPSPTPQPTPSLPLSLIDNTGYKLTIAQYPQRIVSLAPANTQILFAVGAGDKVVGVTKYCNYPYNFSAWIAAGNMSSIGSYYNPAIEPIVALNPDLVVAALGSSDCATQLRNLGYKVLILNPADIYGVLNNIQLIGNATNHYTDAKTLVNNLQQRIDVVVNGVKSAATRPKVYNEIYTDPYTTIGKGTFIDGLIKLAGGQNIFENATEAYPKVSSEAIITQNPDVIIFPSNMGATKFWGSFADVSNRPGWSTINAIKNQNLYVVIADMINQPGPRQVDALEALAKIIHPEIFGQYINPT